MSRDLHNTKEFIRRAKRIIGGIFNMRRYSQIPVTTRFFRNKPLIKEVFNILQLSCLTSPRLFFHACSTGEEPYSYAMFNLDSAAYIDLKICAADYNSGVLNMAKEAVFSKSIIEKINKDKIAPQFNKYFEKKIFTYRLKPQIQNSVSKWLLLDYTDSNSNYENEFQSEVVFCNSSLLYHSHNVQADVLHRLCLQSTELLILTGAENIILEEVLKRHMFVPYKHNWEAIYDGCSLRRMSIDKEYETPTTPYLSDKNREIDQYFRYSIFIRKSGRVADMLIAAGYELTT